MAVQARGQASGDLGRRPHHHVRYAQPQPVLAHQRDRARRDGLGRVVVAVDPAATDTTEQRAAPGGAAVACDVGDVDGFPVPVVGNGQERRTIDRRAVEQCAQVHGASADR